MRYLFALNPYNQQRQFHKPVWVYPVHLAMYATYLRNAGHEVCWEKSCEMPDHIVMSDSDIDVEFDKLPYPDRLFTDALHPRWQAYGNYKYHPATHMMVSNLCWYGKCKFCVEKKKLEIEKRYVRSVSHVVAEIDNIIELGFKEVFDDSGTFPCDEWLDQFYLKMLRRKIVMGCNLRLQRLDFGMLKSIGFRMVLVGVESANQRTLNNVNKGIRSEDIIPIFKSMSDAGLEPHATVMFGYPWEDHFDAMMTVELVHELLTKGYVKTVQASIYMPPRTAPDALNPNYTYIKRVYDIYKKPLYWARKLRDIKNLEDFMYLLKRVNHIWRAE